MKTSPGLAVLVLAAAWASSVATVRAAGGERPNVVLIMADDVSPEMFGCYGCPDAKTPTLDRMAEQGVMFRTAWGSALCSPARAALMTGRYAFRTGAWSNGLSTSPTSPRADSPAGRAEQPAAGDAGVIVMKKVAHV